MLPRELKTDDLKGGIKQLAVQVPSKLPSSQPSQVYPNNLQSQQPLWHSLFARSHELWIHWDLDQAHGFVEGAFDRVPLLRRVQHAGSD